MGMLKGNQINGYLRTRQRIALIVDDLKGKNSGACSAFIIEGTPGSLKPDGDAKGCELAQGVLKVAFARLAGQQFLSTDGTTEGGPEGQWGGAPDMCARIEAYNYALNAVARGSLQTLRVYAYSTSDGCLNSILGAEISVYERSDYSVAGKGCETAITLKVSQRCRGVIGTQTNLLVVDDRSDGSQHSGVQGTAATKCYNSAMSVFIRKAGLRLRRGLRASTSVRLETAPGGCTPSRSRRQPARKGSRPCSIFPATTRPRRKRIFGGEVFLPPIFNF